MSSTQDFKIRRGTAGQLFLPDGSINPKLIIEPGCWYLTTDTAELFLGIGTSSDDAYLKRINGKDDWQLCIAGIEINAAGELVVYYSDGTSINLGVVGSHIENNLSVKIGDIIYDQLNGIIELPEFVTVDTLNDRLSQFNNIDFSSYITKTDLEPLATKDFVVEQLTTNLEQYVKKDELDNFTYEIPEEYITEDELLAKGYLQLSSLDTLILDGGAAIS